VSDIRVVIADDQVLVRGGLRMIVEAQPDMEVVGEAGDGKEAVRVVRETGPDVVLMDVRMPVLDGIEATRLVLHEPDPPRVLVLTTFDADEHVYDAMHAGASGFLLKDVRPEDLARGVRVVAAGETLLAQAVTRRLIERFVRRPSPGSSPDLDDLTSREIEVLEMIASGKSNAEIASALFVSEATVKTHVTHLLAKLGVRDRVQAVIFAYESGLVEPGVDRPAIGRGRAGHDVA
jgi:DNA-binding NarL/FixJ family response regulator